HDAGGSLAPRVAAGPGAAATAAATAAIPAGAARVARPGVLATAPGRIEDVGLLGLLLVALADDGGDAVLGHRRAQQGEREGGHPQDEGGGRAAVGGAVHGISIVRRSGKRSPGEFLGPPEAAVVDGTGRTRLSRSR